jgi:hypothetical protein
MQILEKQGFTLPEPIYRLRFDPGIHAAIERGIAGNTQLASVESNAVQSSLRGVSDTTKQSVEVHDLELDVSPDTHLTTIVDEEIMIDSGNDLLDEERPGE